MTELPNIVSSVRLRFIESADLLKAQLQISLKISQTNWTFKTTNYCEYIFSHFVRYVGPWVKMKTKLGLYKGFWYFL